MVYEESNVINEWMNEQRKEMKRSEKLSLADELSDEACCGLSDWLSCELDEPLDKVSEGLLDALSDGLFVGFQEKVSLLTKLMVILSVRKAAAFDFSWITVSASADCGWAKWTLKTPSRWPEAMCGPGWKTRMFSLSAGIWFLMCKVIFVLRADEKGWQCDWWMVH